MSQTRCKFRCESVTKTIHWRKPGEFLYTAAFNPVTGGSPENESFWEATPSGRLEVCSIVSDQFIPGQCYYLDLTAAPA